MDPIQLKNYLKKRKIAPLEDIVNHFKAEALVVELMCDLWIRKGKLVKYTQNLGCAKGCCKCASSKITLYEWVD
ncbi:hypothetical protein DBT_1093 [Dissulfuribacter thermophilus]|uniref:Transcriptional regulator HTH-type FeoC domain-containing protein n=1 Tax=Dissulfuribacter thermophilus TaxID=1156395 RepID=A0A1B9F5Z4_9BACT|nr:FeoC-like transcriptional regulator [Dissulfuribacter thermophilus]OCC15346.1 hypothetical protein DBT_1093 [Dissulfuribacter thermophilus]